MRDFFYTLDVLPVIPTVRVKAQWSEGIRVQVAGWNSACCEKTV